MNVFTSSIAIRHLLVADAVISGTTGIVLIALAGTVEPLLNIPAPLMRTAGVSSTGFRVGLFIAAPPIESRLAWARASNPAPPHLRHGSCSGAHRGDVEPCASSTKSEPW